MSSAHAEVIHKFNKDEKNNLHVERARGGYPVVVSERTLRELYSYSFLIAVRESDATGIMAAYNNVNGTVCPQNGHVQLDILKHDIGLKGFILSDWSATRNHEEAAQNGLDLPCPETWGGGLTGMVPNTIPQYVLDDMARRWIWARYRTGCFEPGYSIIAFQDSVDSDAHYQYMRRATRKSIVLARNDGNILPLDKNQPISIAVVGPWADEMRWFIQASSQVNPKHHTSPKAALEQIGGSNITITEDYSSADYAMVCVGPDDLGEGRDRVPVSLPDSQNQLCEDVLEAKPNNTIVYYTGGSASDSGAWSNAPAILMSFFAGEDHTLALAEVIFGDYNPAGRIPFTFPADSTQLPRFGINEPWDNTGLSDDQYEDAWEGRGYHYFDYNDMEPLFYFGHGLSYTSFEYSNIQITPAAGFPGDTFNVSVDITNTGDIDGEEVVQMYVHDRKSALPRRYKDLRGFGRVPVSAGKTETVSFKLTEQDIEYYDDSESAWIVEPGAIDILIGASSHDIRQTGVLEIY